MNYTRAWKVENDLRSSGNNQKAILPEQPAKQKSWHDRNANARWKCVKPSFFKRA